MKFTIKKECMAKALQKVCGITTGNKEMPILANVLLDVKDAKLTLSATNLKIWSQVEVKDVVKTEDGSTTIPAKKLQNLISCLPPESEVTFEADEKFHTTVKTGTSTILMVGLDPKMMPENNQIEISRTITMKGEDFVRMINAVAYATATEDARKVLEGILIDINRFQSKAVATDGKRLSIYEKATDSKNAEATMENDQEDDDGADEGIDEEDIEETDEEVGNEPNKTQANPLGQTENRENQSVIITREFANEAIHCTKNDRTVTLGLGQTAIGFKSDNTTLRAKLIEGQFPPYQQIIPKTFKTTLEVPIKEVLYALEILNTINPSVIDWKITREQIIMKSSGKDGEGTQAIPITNSSGDEYEITVNPKYIIDPLKTASTQNIRIKLNSETSAICITDEKGITNIFMPIRKK